MGTGRRPVGWHTLMAAPAAMAAGLASAALVSASRGLNNDELWHSVWAVVAISVCAGFVSAAGREDRRLALAAAVFGLTGGIGRDVAGWAAVLEFVLYPVGTMWLVAETMRYRLGPEPPPSPWQGHGAAVMPDDGVGRPAR